MENNKLLKNIIMASRIGNRCHNDDGYGDVHILESGNVISVCDKCGRVIKLGSNYINIINKYPLISVIRLGYKYLYIYLSTALNKKDLSIYIGDTITIIDDDGITTNLYPGLPLDTSLRKPECQLN